MRVFYGFENLPQIKIPIVTIGSFDGVHRGHRLLIEQMKSLALERGGESVVITFDPHPRQILKGENRLLSTIDEKIYLLAETGVDNVIVVNFTQEFSRIPYHKFIEDYITSKLHTAVLFVGEGHHFGHNRQGSVDVFSRYGIESRKLERYENISSTQIRTFIEMGDMCEASKLLGSRGYFIKFPLIEASKLLPILDRYYKVEMAGKEVFVKIDSEFLRNNDKDIKVLCEK